MTPMQATIGLLASRPVISVDLDTPVLEAFRIMSDRRISSLVVLLHGEPVGIITERDVAFAANWVLGQRDVRLREVMSKPVLTACGETTVSEAYRLFRSHRLRHLVVLGSAMEMDGIFTQTDLVRALAPALFATIPDITQVMSAKVWHVSPQTSTRYTLALMASHAISSMVVAENGQLLGIFTERDAVRLIAAGTDLADLPIAQVMSTPVLTVPPATSPWTAYALMREQAVRHLLVVGAQGELAGILTQTDLSRVLDHQEQPLLSRLLGSILPPEAPQVYAC